MPYQKIIPKEISWLAFNGRVLQEARDKRVPVIERIKYLGIYSNNLDEFFRVRVATLKRLAELGTKASDMIGYNPKKVLKDIHKIVIDQNNLFEQTYNEILQELAKENIRIINENELNPKQTEFVRDYFHREVRPKLMPIMLNQVEAFPALQDEAIYLAVTLTRKNKKVRYALMEIPTEFLPRFIILPASGTTKYIIILDDVVRFGLKEVFRSLKHDEVKAYTVKLTKDAELDISDDMSESYVKKISKSLKQREEGDPVRFVFDADIPTALLHIFIKGLKFTKYDALIPGGRYHNFKDFMKFPVVGRPDLAYKPFKNVLHRSIKPDKSILKTIKNKDLLLHFPYHSFDYFIDILREASIDPKVQSINITLYRLAKNSTVINALINAVRNGKSVTAIVELQARFDEEANIYWSNKLQEEGVRVIFGAYNLKVHAKICLITRRDNGIIENYTCVGTGNFNEDSADIFSDHLLFTKNPKVSNEVVKVFEFFEKNYALGNFRHLLLSPFHMRKKIFKLIHNEIKNAREGKEAYILLKLNNLVDEEVISTLYHAADAGVKIKLNVRGMCSLIPGFQKKKENIEAITIIDRFLEHSRIFIFCNSGNPLYYISSADIMPRNLDKRIEIACPIYDETIKKEIREFWDLQWKDNLKARTIDSNFKNEYRTDNSKIKSSGQENIYRWLKEETVADTTQS